MVKGLQEFYSHEILIKFMIDEFAVQTMTNPIDQ